MFSHRSIREVNESVILIINVLLTFSYSLNNKRRVIDIVFSCDHNTIIQLENYAFG